MSVLIQTRFAADTLTAEYSNGNTQTVRLDKFTAHNTDSSAQLLTVHLVPSGDVPSAANMQMEKSVPANDTWLCPEMVGQDLDNGDSIYVKAATASKVSIRCNGRLV